MGVLTKLSIEEINKLIVDTRVKFVSIQETANGITDSTYIGTDKEGTRYLFKVFETSNIEDVKTKRYILNNIKALKVPKVLSPDIPMYKDKPTILFSFIKGKIPKEIKIEQIKEISLFFKELHGVKDVKPENLNIYEKSYMEKMISMVKNKEDLDEFKSRFALINDIKLPNNALIHGDLFPDNAKFVDNKLSGVYDFAQSCYGNAYFDLSVMLVSWCFDEEDYKIEFLEKALETYDKNIKVEEIKPYMLYACLYYALQRYTRVNKAKDFRQKLVMFDTLQKIL